MRQQRLVMLLVLLGLLAGIGQGWAVTASDTTLPIDESGNKIYTSAKNTWVPIAVFFVFFVLGVVFIVGMRSLAGFAARAVFACIFFAIACSGAAAAFFPGLVTSLTLP